MSILITSPKQTDTDFPTTPILAPPSKAPTTTATEKSSSTVVPAWLGRRLDNTAPHLLLVEAFFGLGWLRAAAEKIPNADWWSGEVIRGFVSSHADATLPWYQAVLDVIVSPFTVAVGVVVVALQLFAGFSLLSGLKLKWGLTAGIFLNLSFLAVGAVNPSAFYLIGQGVLALALLASARPSYRLADKMRIVVGAAFGMVLVNIPFVGTLDPHGVIEDPAMMFVTLGALTMLTVATTYRSMFSIADDAANYDPAGYDWASSR